MSLDLKHKIVTVIGAARSGVAAASIVARRGGRPQISESKAASSAELEALKKGGVRLEVGGHTRDFVEGSSLVVLSPGVRLDSEPVLWARAKGIEVMGEIEFAYRLCPCPIVAVTGSNGKTTTSTVIARILERAGRRPVLCGNIGTPFSKHVLDLSPDQIVVLETSSFQLEATSTFKPQVAVWLNFSQNHLDRHKDLKEYFEAKAKIFANQGPGDWAVLNAAQPEFSGFAKSLKAQVLFFNEGNGPALGNPNFMAARAAAKALGISPDVAEDVLRNFKGIEHRQEWVRAIDGVDYINDSKCTTPEAGRWAMTQLRKPLIMICGGSDKHADFMPLKEMVRLQVKQMIVMGQTAEQLAQTFSAVVPLQRCASLAEALEAARQNARAGDTVALSPMCASFDMFQDYEHRGRVFKELVQGLGAKTYA